jgi:hypothetical protein
MRFILIKIFFISFKEAKKNSWFAEIPLNPPHPPFFKGGDLARNKKRSPPFEKGG